MHVGHKHFLPHANVAGDLRARRKKPSNPEEIAPVKGRFSEGEQEERRQRPPQNPPKSVRREDGTDAVEVDTDFGGRLSTASSDMATSAAAMPSAPPASAQMSSARAAARLDALLSGIIDERSAVGSAAAAPGEPAAEPSLSDLLALMRTASRKS